jgi:GTP-binding protein
MKNRFRAELLHTAYRPDQLQELSLPAVVLIGRSNSGKSSLLNALTGVSEARVSKQPGKTRSVNYYRYGPRLTLVDVPGYGYARRNREEIEQWRDLMKVFFNRLPPGALIFILVDAKRDLEEEEFELLGSLGGASHRIQILLTKADRLKQSTRRARQEAMQRIFFKSGQEKVLTWRFVSVKTGEEIEAIRRDLHQYGKTPIVEAEGDDSEGSQTGFADRTTEF